MIASFVVRIFQDGTEAADSILRVTVRHVQTGDERQFAQLEDAFTFMRTFTADTQELQEIR